jgi:diguanylate cyclase (GGDEF)-like protein
MKPIKILIVEDELLIARNLAKKLKKIGYSVTEIVSSSEAGLKSIDECCPDLILMDIVIKGEKDGIDTATEINENYQIPIIYLTAYADDLTLERAEKTGSYGYILKPYSEKELHATIKMALSKHQQYQSILEKSILDPLTDLYNRRYLEEALDKELLRAKRHQYPVSLILIDIDHFKQVNDNYGHNTGDEVLKRMADIMRNNVRNSDIICRYGGEEILILLPECSLEKSSFIAELLRKIVSEIKVACDNFTLTNITISAGIASFPDHGLTRKALIEVADVALYQAKAQGRNQIVVGKSSSSYLSSPEFT